jgi:hypothetical protein
LNSITGRSSDGQGDVGGQSILVSGGNHRGIEIMHMICKGQAQSTGKLLQARQFYSLAG